MTTVAISRTAGLWVCGPPDSPSVLDAAARADTLALAVVGGHLTWSLTATHRVPMAVLDDLDHAHDWLWRVYGETVAVAIAQGATGHRDATPTTMAARLWRLGYAHWASRWWPASTLDGIPSLDPTLLDDEIAELADECDDVIGEDTPAGAPAASRADDYALVAGPGAQADAVVLATGTVEWDWRRCPPGVLDAADRAVSWQLLRRAGNTTLAVTAVAAPHLRDEVRPHLRPHVRVGANPSVPFTLVGDTWHADLVDPGPEVNPEVFVPACGFGHHEPTPIDIQRHVRALVLSRMTDPPNPADPLLRAETAARATDPHW